MLSPTRVSPSTVQHDGQAREDTRPPDTGRGVGERLVQVEAPFGGGAGFDAEAEEAQAGEGQDGFGGVEREDQRQGPGGVPVDVPGHDADVRGTHHLGRFDERFGLEPDGFGPDHPEVLRDEHHGDGDRRSQDRRRRGWTGRR